MTCKSTALCLFDEADVQMDIIRSIRVDYYPETNITPGAPIEFRIPGTPDEYIDLGDIRILMHLKITNKDGTNLIAGAKVGFINQPLSSCFQDVFLKIADTQVEGGQHLYPYNAYLSTLLQFHPSAKRTHLEAWGWSEDTPAKFNDVTGGNNGFTLRSTGTQGSNVWEIMGPLILDMTRQPRYLLPQTNLHLKFSPAKDAFVLIGHADNYKYEIVKCELQVPRISVLDAVVNGHNKGLEKYIY